MKFGNGAEAALRFSVQPAARLGGRHALPSVVLSLLLFASPAVLAQRPLGVDVSHWQGSINWTQVKNSGRAFALTKASEGVNYADNTFVTNVTNAKAVGIYVGPYHFARPEYGNSATAEANWFIAVAGNYMTAGHLPPVLDLETGSGLGKTALSAWVNEFCGRIQAVKGIKPLVYTNVNYATNYLNSSVNTWPLWIASWPSNPNPQADNPSTGVWPTWRIWQYSATGSVPGISGNCDLDVFNGTLAELQGFLISGEPLATIVLSPGTLAPETIVGLNAAGQTFTVRNGGGGTLGYSIAPGTTWLSVTPASGTSTGETDTISVSYNVAALPIGTYTAEIAVTAAGANNSPQAVAVTLTVQPIPGDMDGDGDIDPTDLSAFVACMTGPGVFQSDRDCRKVDYDGDLDVDQSDYGVIQACLSGSTVPASVSCLPAN